MAYIFHEDEPPRLISVTPGRESTFFVNQELTNIDNMPAGIMHYKRGASPPYHFHKNCEHFYFIMERQGTVESEEDTRKVGPGDTVPTGSKPRFWTVARTICAGIAYGRVWVRT